MRTDGDHTSSPPPSGGWNAGEYFGILVRGKWIILAALVLMVSLSLLYLKFSDPVFRATSRILINKRFVQSSLFLEVLRSWDAEKNLAQNELEILRSQSLAAQVAMRLIEAKKRDSTVPGVLPILQPQDGQDSARSLASIDQVAPRLTAAVDFDVVPETDVITISARSKDAREAALIANAYAQVYYDRNIQASRAKSRSFREFLGAQLKDKRRALSETEDSLENYMQRRGIVMLDAESKTLIEQLAHLEAQRDETNITIESLTKTLASYQEQIPDQEKIVARSIGEANDPYIRLLQEQLAKLEVQRDVTVAQNPSFVGKEIYSDKLKEIDDQINTLRGKLQKRTDEFLRSLLPGGQEVTSDKDPAGYLKLIKQKLVETSIDLQALQAKKDALTATIQQYERAFSQIPEKSIQFARLERSRLSSEKLFLMVQEKYNEATISEQSEFGYLDIIDPASVPDRPASPNVPRIFLVGIIGGIGFGLIAVFVRERLDVRVQTPEELKLEGYAVLGTIMRMRNGPNHKGRGSLWTLAAPYCSEAESFRHIRTHLQYARRDLPLTTILVTSSKPGEGKTTTVSNLAVTFAQASHRVLLIDADLRKPALHARFNLPMAPGLADYLGGRETLEDVIRGTGIENLDMVCCGTGSDAPDELLGSERMRQFFDQVRRQHDLILLDSSPVLVGTGPSVLSTMVDEVIVVASAGDTRLNELQQTLEILMELCSRKPDVVLNNFNIRRAYGIPYGRSGIGYYHYPEKGRT